MESVSGVDGNRAISLFSNEWFANLKADLKKLEEMELRTEGKKTLSNGLKVALSYNKFLATAALDNVIITPKMNLTNTGRTIFLSSSPTSLAFFLITILLLVPVLTATTVFAQEIPPIISGIGGGSLGLPSSAITYSGVPPPPPTTTTAASSHAPTSTEESPLRVAFIKPSFTYAAYSLDGFYTFYDKYSDETDETTNVTTDLNMLTVEVPDETYIHYKDDPSDPPTVPVQQEYYDTLRGLVEQRSSSQNETVSIKDDDEGGGNGDDLPPIQIADITDKEVHEGKIFDSAGNNAYDVLFLFHQEYVTQEEYDNLKKFVVQNGGTIVFNTANTFTVEVKYDSADNTVTLVRGHTWAYDGSSCAWRAYPRERWINENQQWVGSNFIEDPQSDDVTFSNNPFNYEHSEEQFVTNPNATIIHDFEVMEEDTQDEGGDERQRQRFPDLETVVATYEMISGKGKVINLGIFGHTLDDNEAFLDFYDEEILPRALG
jgi:hypothetical protein